MIFKLREGSFPALPTHHRPRSNICSSNTVCVGVKVKITAGCDVVIMWKSYRLSGERGAEGRRVADFKFQDQIF